jgi:hypothetical protein
MQSPFGHLNGRFFGHLAKGHDCFCGSTQAPEKHFKGYFSEQPFGKEGQEAFERQVPSAHKVRLFVQLGCCLGQEEKAAAHCPLRHL